MKGNKIIGHCDHKLNKITHSIVKKIWNLLKWSLWPPENDIKYEKQSGHSDHILIGHCHQLFKNISFFQKVTVTKKSRLWLQWPFKIDGHSDHGFWWQWPQLGDSDHNKILKMVTGTTKK